MGDKDKSRKIGDSVKEMAHYAEEQRLGQGRIEFDELGNAIWGADAWDLDMLYRLVRRVKEKLEPRPDRPRYLQTVRGVGYRLVP